MTARGVRTCAVLSLLRVALTWCGASRHGTVEQRMLRFELNLLSSPHVSFCAFIFPLSGTGGQTGANSQNCNHPIGLGGSQTSGGAFGGGFGQGGHGSTGTPWNGGGGGGWYGGGASTAHGGGGGGSSYIRPGLVRNGNMQQGGQQGDGRVIITVNRP